MSDMLTLVECLELVIFIVVVISCCIFVDLSYFSETVYIWYSVVD